MIITLLSMFSVMAALMMFSAIVLFGGFLVRRLRLPTDLPFDLHFTVPPPPLVTHGDPEKAALVASQQQHDQQVYDQAQTLCAYFFECESAAKELADWDDTHVQGVHKKIVKLVKNNHSDQKKMDNWVKNGEILQYREKILTLNDRYVDSNAELQELLNSLPQPGIKRILILTGLLILCTGMLFAAHMLSQQ